MIKRAGKPLNSESIVSILALLLSIIAILISALEVSTARSSAKAAVWPHLNVFIRDDSSGFFINIENKGVGPALVENLEFSLDGKLITDMETAIIDTVGLENEFEYDRSMYTDVNNRVLGAGENQQLFAIPLTPFSRKLIEHWPTKVDVQACYCSIQDDCWQTSLVGQETLSVENCQDALSTRFSKTELAISKADFEPLLGTQWEGDLQYLDYTSGQTSTIPVSIEMDSIDDRRIVYRLNYPQEPQYNSIERLDISRGGTRINGYPIVERRALANSVLQITTQYRGQDNQQPADIRYVYEISNNTFVIRQMVRPDNATDFFERNRYYLTR